MQNSGVDILFVVIGGSAILLLLAVAYIVVTISSHRRVLEAQQTKLDEVRKSEEKYRSLFDNSLAGIMKFSPDTWTVVDSNEAIRTLFGCGSQEELRGCLANLSPSSREPIRQSLAREGRIAGYEIQTTRKDGEELWILFSAKMMTGETLAQAVVVDITKRKEFEETIREQSALLDQTQDAIMVVDDRGKVTFWNAGAELMYGWAEGGDPRPCDSRASLLHVQEGGLPGSDGGHRPIQRVAWGALPQAKGWERDPGGKPLEDGREAGQR